VQGVGFRNFVQREATRLGIHGFTRNLDDGSVEVYAIGSHAQLSDLAGLLRIGPRWADVHGVNESEASVDSYRGFYIRS
jgi:acylphosphatase